MYKKVVSASLSLLMVVGVVASNQVYVQAKNEIKEGTGQLQGIRTVEKDNTNRNIVWITFTNGMKGKLTFLDNNIFRYNVDPSNKFNEYATVREGYPDTAKIQQYPDNSEKYTHPDATVSRVNGGYDIKAGNVTVSFDSNAKMSIKSKDKVVMQEKEALSVNSSTVQTLVKDNQKSEQFFGGGTQNGRFVHTGKSINIANESGWNDGQVSSPNPFYYTTKGYGVLRNTYQNGRYNFGSSENDTVTTTHSENEFDAYYFVSDKENGREVSQELLQGYFKVTGNPVLLPEYGFYLGHLNAYNRDAWSKDKNIGKAWTIKGNASHASQGTTTYERGGTGTSIQAGETAETLNGHGPKVATQNVPKDIKYSKEFSAQGVLDNYVKYDIPFGFFLPNDGYGAGYGQNGYKVTGGIENGKSTKERLAAVAANVENLKEFADYAKEKGIATGLWTQSQLVPDNNPQTQWHLLRDFENEVKAGVTTLKTDVAWVGPGYSFQLSGVKQAYDIVTTMKYDDNRANTRPNIISLDGWAGSQRYNSVWTGDQTGGNWDYIRFHIPTFIGQSLSGNPNIGTDMDGIWGGNPIIATRDYQWKSFAPQMLDMDGWGTYMKAPYTHGDPYTGVSRMYLKLKAMMMPYVYTNAYAAANIDTGNDDQGLPMVRAMFLEYPNEPMAFSDAAKYQYMWGENLLVAPVYKDTDQDQDKNNDVRDGIYLPGGSDQVWIDYFTGQQYRGGQVLNGFDAPLWKLPLFVKNGAIIPMHAENNSAYKIDRTQRLVEFWPEGKTEFNAIEDDGTYIENKVDKSNKEYGVIDNISYGNHVKTKYTSEVKGDTATLIANKSTGTYNNYQKDKNTTFIVNASKNPTSLEVFNGKTKLTKQTNQINSKEEFDKAKVETGKYISYYDENPTIETFASEDEKEIANLVKDVEVSGKLYVKFASTDAQANEQKLVIHGFENKSSLNSDELNEDLNAPTNFKEMEEAKTPASVSLTWDKNADANTYEILVDGEIDKKGNIVSGVINSVPSKLNTFTHTGLKYLTEHSYYIRSVNEKGHSEWSKELKATTANDPFINSPEPTKVTWSGKLYGTHNPQLAFDKEFQKSDGGFHSSNNAIGEKLTADFGNAYLFDYIEFYPRDDAGNGTPQEMRVETSLDGVHWIQHGNQEDEKGNKYFQCNPDKEMKKIDLSDPFRTDENKKYIGARYIRFTPLKTIGTFFSASEIKPFAIKGESSIGGKQKPFRVGNLLTQGTNAPTLDTFKSVYLKESSAHKNEKSPQWIAEIRDTYCDINYNGISDIWDYTFSGFHVDGSEINGLGIKGTIGWVPSAKTIKKGEKFTITLNAKNAVNISAFGGIINYNPKKVRYENVSYIAKELFTDGMTAPITYDDGTAYINHGAMFLGNKYITSDRVLPSQNLSTITLTALEDITLNDITDVKDPNFVMDLSQAIMIAPDHSFVISNDSNIEQPENDYKLMGLDQFDITLTNEYLKTDDGENVERLIQQKSLEPLFNQSFGRDWELKYDIQSNYGEDGKLPQYITLPLTAHLALKSPKFISDIKVLNANKGNGYLTSVKAQVTYEDGSKSEEQLLNEESKSYVFNFSSKQKSSSKKVKNIDITFLTSTGVTASQEANRMLTLSEIEVYGKDKSDKEEIHKEELETSIQKAEEKVEDLDQYTPESVDPFRKALDHAKTVFEKENATQLEIDEANKLLKEAMENLTEKEVVNKDALQEAINKKPAKEEAAYTKDSWKAYQDALTNANKVMQDANAKQADVDEAYKLLKEAMENLTEKEVVNKDALQEAINKKPSKEEAAYTKDSWKAYQDALTNANKVMQDVNATQTDVNQAKEQLLATLNELKEVSNNSQITPENPNNNSNKNHAATGDSTNPVVLWTIVLGAGVMALITLKRSKNSKI